MVITVGSIVVVIIVIVRVSLHNFHHLLCRLCITMLYNYPPCHVLFCTKWYSSYPAWMANNQHWFLFVTRKRHARDDEQLCRAIVWIFNHRPAGKMRSAARASCVCWVSARTPLKGKQEPSAKNKATATAIYAVPSMKVPTSKQQNLISPSRWDWTSRCFQLW